jgi:hypothetical protein
VRPHVISFFAFPPDVRKVIYTTNALASVHARIRKILKPRGQFPTDVAAVKLLWLALGNITATWGKEPNFWRSARNQFAIVYGERFTHRDDVTTRLTHEFLTLPRLRGHEDDESGADAPFVSLPSFLL